MTQQQKQIIALSVIDQLKRLVEIAAADSKITAETREYIECEMEHLEGTIDMMAE